MTCVIESCVRDAEADLCKLHQTAADNLEAGFPAWKKAYGNQFNYEDYLNSLLEDEVGTGQLVQDIVEYKLQQETVSD